MFPSGQAGLALVIMRLGLVGMLSLHAYRFGPIALSFWSIPVLLLIAAALSAGAVTKIACVLYCTAETGFVLTAKGFDATVLILSVPVAIALALLGPGAYSLDARIFGRRVIDIRPEDDIRRR
jgi:hypothetical protein